MRRGLSIAVAVTIAVAAAPAAVAVPGVQCGEVVEEAVQLEADLLDCPGDGIVVAAKDVVVDLNGFTIDSDGSEGTFAVNNEDGYNGLVVTDGTITDFEVGIYVAEKGEDVEISEIAFVDNGSAVVLVDSERNLVEDNTFEANDFGIALRGDENAVEGNEFFETAPAIAMQGNRNEVAGNDIVFATARRLSASIAIDGDRNTIVENEVMAGGGGIDGIGSDNALVDNRLEGGASTGITWRGSRNVLEKNEVRAHDGYGIDLQDDEPGRNYLLKNDVEDSGRDGVIVRGDDAVLEKNELNGNGGDGAQVDGSDAVLTENEADGNGGYGIRIDGRGAASDGNEASGNGATTQCRPSEVCE